MSEAVDLPVDIEEYLNARKAEIDRSLDRFLPAADSYPAPVHTAMRYSIFAGGKRIRPILALAAVEALDGDLAPAIHLACALEMIHTYSLIHDDLPAMDNDDFRRGKPTCHREFGEGIAILAGNGLLTHAFQLLAELPCRPDQDSLKVEIIHTISRAIGTQQGVIAGQVVDLLKEGEEFGREELEFIHRSKTGSLIQASVDSAALLSGADQDQRRAFQSFGEGIGLAFQIVDDILDVVESSDQLGKTSGKDVQGRKATYPALFGIEKSREIVNEVLKEALCRIDFLGPRGKILRHLAHFISVRRF